MRRILLSRIVLFILICAAWTVTGIVFRFSQNGLTTSIFNYTSTGLTINIGDKEKCMEELGCFGSGAPFFHPVLRPVSLLPQDRDDVATAFLLYTRSNPLFFHFLRAGEPDTVFDSYFMLRAETKIIVPGWMDNLRVSNWMQLKGFSSDRTEMSNLLSANWFQLEMKDALLNYANCNVIVVDWSKSNGIPFALAVANTRVVGAEIALLINFLWKYFGVRPEKFHIIGHSLGTEIAGYAGQRVKNLGRITALDPAGPYFRNVSTEVRLDPSDALFVDAIHAESTDIAGDGPSRLEQTGHIDFYPNGGEMQPGCPSAIIDTFIQKGVLEGARNLLVCDHYRVIDYFIATIPNHYGCRPLGVACDSWESFVSGLCGDCGINGSSCEVMGFEADKSKHRIKSQMPRKFFLYTSSRPPFCVRQYHVSVRLKVNSSVKRRMGDLYVTLKGKYGSISTLVNKRDSFIRPGAEYRTVVTSDEDIGADTAIFRWTCSTLKISDTVTVNIHSTGVCNLYLQHVRITRFSSSKNPKTPNHLTMCGPEFPIPPDMDIALGKETYC